MYPFSEIQVYRFNRFSLWHAWVFSFCMEKNSIEFDILYFGSGWEKLEEYCCSNFAHISDKHVICLPSMSKGPIFFLVLSFLLAYVKKYLGFDFMFSIARSSFTMFSFSYEFKQFFINFSYGLFYQFLSVWWAPFFVDFCLIFSFF